MINYWHKKVKIPLSEYEYLKTLASLGIEVNENILSVSGEIFNEIFTVNRKYLYRGDFTAPPCEEAYKVNKNYITKDGLSGFSISESGWIISVFSNSKDISILKLLDDFVDTNSKVAVLATGDWTKSRLVNEYTNKLDFIPVAVTIDDTAGMIECYGKNFVDDFIENYGIKPKHVFLVKDLSTKCNHIKVFDTYAVAYDYIDNNYI